MLPGEQSQAGLSPEELQAELATDLPERDALSIVDPAVFSVLPVAPVARAADVATPSSVSNEAQPA